MACSKRNIQDFKRSGDVLLVGDMNAHIADMYEYTYLNANIMADMCEFGKLIIVNREQKCGA